MCSSSPAADVDALTGWVRDHFVALHETPLLETLAEDLGERYPSLEFSPPPETGDFDLSSVYDSHYFFS